MSPRNPEPLVTVAMAVHNGACHLPEALDSVLGQTFCDFELVVVNDGSTDETGEILGRYQQRDPRLRVIQQDKQGLALSLNTSVNEARGRYVARLDADDVALPRRLERQVDFLERNREVGLLGGAVVFITSAGSAFASWQYPLDDSEIRRKLARASAFVHPTVMMRADHLRAVGGYRRSMLGAEDYDLWLRLAERCRMANLAEPVLRYRIHPGQASRADLEQQTRSVLAAQAAARMRSELGHDPLTEVELVTDEVLRTLGVGCGEFAEALVDAQIYWAKTMARAGYDSAALALWRDARSSYKRPGADRVLRSHVLRARAELAYEQGKTVRGKALAALSRLARHACT